MKKRTLIALILTALSLAALLCAVAVISKNPLCLYIALVELALLFAFGLRFVLVYKALARKE